MSTAPGQRFRVARIYEEPRATTDSEYRVLVDRLWPRGLRKDSVQFDEWCKDVAPSTELRKWYGHQPERFEEFTRRYREELGGGPEGTAVTRLRTIARDKTVVILTATKDLALAQATVLAEYLRAH